jgi:hypothetical protein
MGKKERLLIVEATQDFDGNAGRTVRDGQSMPPDTSYRLQDFTNKTKLFNARSKVKLKPFRSAFEIVKPNDGCVPSSRGN